MKRVVLVLAAISAASGCYRTRFDLAPPQPEVPSGVYNDHFHFSFLGVIEVSRPVDFQAACMGAPPTAVEEQIGVLAGLIDALLIPTADVLHLHNASVYCPMGGIAPSYGPQTPMGPQPASPEPVPPQP